jgi:cobalt-zinc-cadmium efflux system membrane fusion protein
MNTKMSLIRYVLPAAVLVSVLSMFSCHTQNQPSTDELTGTGYTEGDIVITKEQFDSSGMKLGEPTLMMFRQVIRANGNIVASPSGWARISTMIPGRVTNIHLTEGDYVKKGQLLFSVEGNEIILLQQEYAESFNQLNSLKASYERQKTLSEAQITAQKEYLNAESEYLSLASKADGLRARLSLIGIDPVRVESGTVVPIAPVYSPIQGFVTKQDLVHGQYVEPHETVMEVIDTDQLRLQIQVFEKDLAGMAIGQKVLCYSPDNMEQVFEATLSHIGKSIDPETRTVRCVAQLHSPDRRSFINNVYVQAEIITCQREAPAVPNHSLIREDEWYFLLSLVGEEKGNLIFRRVPVHTGATMPEYTEVLDEGLKDILIEGGYNLMTEE